MFRFGRWVRYRGPRHWNCRDVESSRSSAGQTGAGHHFYISAQHRVRMQIQLETLLIFTLALLSNLNVQMLFMFYSNHLLSFLSCSLLVRLPLLRLAIAFFLSLRLHVQSDASVHARWQSESDCVSPCNEQSHSPAPKPPVAFLEQIEAANHVTAVPPILQIAASPGSLASPLPAGNTPPRLSGWHGRYSTKGRQSPNTLTTTNLPQTSSAQAPPTSNSLTGSLRRSHSPCGKTQSCSLGNRTDKIGAGSRLMRAGSSPVSTPATLDLSYSPQTSFVSSNACRLNAIGASQLTDNTSGMNELTAPLAGHSLPASSPIATRSVATHRRTSSEIDEPNASFGSTGAPPDCSLPTPQYKFMVSAEGLHLLEYPFITMKQFPAGLVRHIGGLVSSRSVKHLAQINSPEDPETRDGWWMELRKEIRSHCRLLGCNAVLGYSESSCIWFASNFCLFHILFLCSNSITFFSLEY